MIKSIEKMPNNTDNKWSKTIIRLRVCLFGYINSKLLSLDKYLGHHEPIAYMNTFLSSNKFVYLFTIVRSQWAFRVLLFKS